MLDNFNTAQFVNTKILVVGDVMLDRYLWGDVRRISPEAPVPIFHIKKQSEVAGGAGNVVANLIGLGCQVTLVGICGNDAAGDQLQISLNRKGLELYLLKDNERPTITKTRLMSAGQQLLRLDEEKTHALDQKLHNDAEEIVKKILPTHDAVILSDYGKGFLQSPNLTQKIIRQARDENIPILIDPKGRDWQRYDGATCITPNSKELELVAGIDLSSENEQIEAAKEIRSKYHLDWLLVTRGPEGMCLFGNDMPPLHISSVAREVFDVSGAGDTVISTTAAGLAAGLSFADSAKLANLAAGIVVGKLGTQPVSKSELEAVLKLSQHCNVNSSRGKITSLSVAKVQIDAWKSSGDTIVFTNGCFDLLHPGHIHILHQAKALGNRLVIGMNSDESVRRLKGNTRPILNEQDRSSLLAALGCVDLVLVFEEDTPLNLISELQPDILVKGADYSIDQVVGGNIVESYGGKVELVDLLEGYSTTNITRKLSSKG